MRRGRMCSTGSVTSGVPEEGEQCQHLQQAKKNGYAVRGEGVRYQVRVCSPSRDCAVPGELYLPLMLTAYRVSQKRDVEFDVKNRNSSIVFFVYEV